MFVQDGFDSGTCMRTNCVVGEAESGGAPSAAAPHDGHHDDDESSSVDKDGGIKRTVHLLNSPNNVRAEVPNLSPRLRSLFFADETRGKELLQRQFGVYVTIDDADSLIIYGSSPASVERCMLLVEECVKNDRYCFQWYRGERGTEVAHTLVTYRQV